MKIDVIPKNINRLCPTDILFQTTYWSHVKNHLGYKPSAFDFASSTGQKGDLLVLIKPLGNIYSAAYVPQGPESGPAPEHYGLFLENLSQALIRHMDPSVIFIRYDLPWASPYAADSENEGPWAGNPSARLRELRMNIGTRTWNLRKSGIDLTVADALVVDLARTEDEILSAMKPKTRYNIRLAQRKGVRVFNASAEMLPAFYNLYQQTAGRNGFYPGSYHHFSALFVTICRYPESPEILFLLAVKDRDILAGAIIAVCGNTAHYLFGASSNENRNLMGSYAVHWEGMKSVRKKGCRSYDMGSVSPLADPGHPFYGMYRFKTGFGGKIVHRDGSWDYPFNMREYSRFRNHECSTLALRN